MSTTLEKIVSINVKPQKEKLLTHYRTLPELEGEILRALAVAHPINFDRNKALEYLNALGITHKFGLKLTHQKTKEIFEILNNKKLLSYHLSIPIEILHVVTLDALQSPRREAFFKKFNASDLMSTLPSFWSPEEQRQAIRLRIYLINETDQLAVDLIAKRLLFSNTIWIDFCHEHIDPVWISQLPLRIRLEIFTHCLSRLWQQNIAVPQLSPLLAFCKNHLGQAGFEAWTKLFLKHAVYSADISLITQELMCCLEADKIEDLLTCASIHFLQGEIEQSTLLFENVLKKAKKNSGKKKIFFHSIEGIYFLLGMIKKSQYAEIQECSLIVIEKHPHICPSLFQHMQLLSSFLKMSPINVAEKMKIISLEANPISYAFVALCRYWIDRQLIDHHQKELLDTFYENCKETLPGIARILAELLSAISTDSSPYLSYLEKTPTFYALSFLNIVPIKEVWEHSLETLEKLYPQKDGVEVNQITPVQNERRFAWLIDTTTLSLKGVLEQKVNAKGAWSQGRAIALHRLKAGDPDLDYGSDQDKRIMQCVISQTYASYGYYTKEEYLFKQDKALLALIDHPNLLDSITHTPLEIVKGNVEMIIKENEGHYLLSLSIPCPKVDTLLKLHTENCYHVIEIKEEFVQLFQALGPSHELKIPKTERKRLQGLIKGIGKTIPVHSDFNDASVRKEGNAIPNVQLLSLEEGGLKLNLTVRPFGAEGPGFRPGHGFQTPQAMIKGKPQRVSRNLGDERQKADQLIEKIELLNQMNSGQDEWIFDNPEDSLTVLSALQSYPDPTVLLWPSGKKISVSPSMSPKALTLRVKGENDWFSLEGELKVDEGHVLELKQLFDLIDNSSSRFVAIGDNQFIALTDHFKRQLRELKSMSEKGKGKGKLLIHALSSSALDEISQEAASFEVDSKWHEARQRIQNAQTHTPLLPVTLQAELRPYQLEGFQWLSKLAVWGVGACLADDMGLGKTLQALALILEHAQKGATLVVAPTSVCRNWINESQRFAPTLEVILHAQERRRETISTLGPMQLLVTSYGLLHQEKELLGSVKWQTVILDEAQVIKNSTTKRSQAAMQLQSNVRVLLTGTPVENRLGELWNLFHFINPGLLGSQESFNKRFAEPIEQQKDHLARQSLKKIIQPFVLRRLKNQVLAELPPRIEKTILIPFSKEEQAFYEALRRNALEKLVKMSAKEKKRIHILAEIMRLRRACCHPTLVMPESELSSTKLETFMELMEELRENHHQMLVFSQFVGCLEKVRTALDERSIAYQYLDGTTPMEERQKRVDAFQAGQGDLFLISLKAGGTGLNLTAADYVIHLDPWWNPAVEDQASDRAHRIGQTRPVTIYRMIMEGTIEEKMIQLHQNKRSLANDLLEGADVSGKMNDDELLALLGG